MISTDAFQVSFLSSLTIVNKGSSLKIVNERLSLQIVNETTSFLKTVVFENDRFSFFRRRFHNESIIFFNENDPSLPTTSNGQ